MAAESDEIHFDRDEAERGFTVTMDMLTSLEEIGPDVQPETSLSGSRAQLAHNVEALLRGYYLQVGARHPQDPMSKAIRDPAQREAYKDDPIMLGVFALMDAFDRRDWTACISELKMLRLVMKFELK
jgi:hypothetical protein